MNHRRCCRIGISLLWASVWLVGSTWGQPPTDPLVDALDNDKDGTVSAAELEQAVESLRSLDRNQDGKLAFDEIMPEFPGFDPPDFGPPGFGPPGFGPPGFGGRGPRMEKRELVQEFDKDNDGRLNREERTAARSSLAEDSRGGGPGGRGRGGPGGRFGRGGARDPATPGPRVAPEDVQVFPHATLYDTSVLRTLFLDFEHDDWQDEMADFKDSDVEVPATLRVDGKVYPNVGVHFRGMSSFMMVPEEYKRSLNLSLNFVDDDQRLYGFRTLNLLNGAGDPSMMSSVLYAHFASHFIPVPKANFVKVVINGESWGIYANVQQFNKDFVKEHYGTGQGSRWKVRGNPGADGGLRYLGEELDEYKQRFQLKSNEDAKAWRRLIELCRTLEETPTDELAAALDSIIDVDQLLWFLAIDVALVNSDGYWTRASDYCLYLDKNDKFHVIPGDVNEAFHGARRFGPGSLGGSPGFGPPGGFGPPEGGPPRFDPPEFGPSGFGPPEVGPPEDGPPEDVLVPRGRRGGFGGGRPNEGSIELDPLVNTDNPRMPLRTKVLAVPRLRGQYLQNVRTIAEMMGSEHTGPVVRQLRELIEEEVKADTRKLATYEAFVEATRDVVGEAENAATGLRHFFAKRQTYLLEHPEVTALPAAAQAAPNASNDVTVKSAAGLVINELMAANTSIKDTDGKFDDWIELLNTSDQAIDLSDVSLSDDDKKPRKWTFPAGTKMGPGEYLLIWADEDGGSAASGLHANFKLSKNGESLLLTQRNGTGHVLLDEVRFGRQRAGVSFGRKAIVSSTFEPLVPTPGEPNRVTE